MRCNSFSCRSPALCDSKPATPTQRINIKPITANTMRMAWITEVLNSLNEPATLMTSINTRTTVTPRLYAALLVCVNMAR